HLCAAYRLVGDTDDLAARMQALHTRLGACRHAYRLPLRAGSTSPATLHAVLTELEQYKQLPGNLSRKGFVPIRGKGRRVTWDYFYIFVVVYCGDHLHADPQTALCR